MKKLTIFLIIILFSTTTLLAKAKIIINPKFELKRYGFIDISKIELTKKETRVYIHVAYLPNRELSFSKKEFIKDPETNKKYLIIGVKDFEIDKKFTMPASGDSTIVLIFPPLAKSIKKIDYNTVVYGISLDKNQKRVANSVPAEITNWLKEEISKGNKKEATDFNSTHFFNTDTARIVGYLKGYDTRLDFKTGLVHAGNELTREDNPIVLNIESDGRFEAKIPLNYPQQLYARINKQSFLFYVEPGQTLGMIVDWNEFLEATKRQNQRYSFKNIEFIGPLSKINQDLAGYKLSEKGYDEFLKKTETISAIDYKKEQATNLKTDLKDVEQYLNSTAITPQASSILKNSIYLQHAISIFDFVSKQEYLARKDTSKILYKEIVPDNFYDFLENIDLNDKSILASHRFSTFINRFEFCNAFKVRANIKNNNQFSNKDFLNYLDKSNVKIKKKYRDLLLEIDNIIKNKNIKELEDQKKEDVKSINEKFKVQLAEFFEKEVKPKNPTAEYSTIENWRLKDSILTNKLHLKPNLIYEICKTRDLKFQFNHLKRPEANRLWENLKIGITDSFLIKIGDEYFNQKFSQNENENKAYELPACEGTDIFKKIIEPHKGKILFIDFWATTCAPCVGGIKRMKPNREKYKDNPDFDFIFITDEVSSPINDYEKLVKDQELSKCFRLKRDEFNYLRQLFKFNGIPHYVVIDKEGKVLNDKFEMYNFENKLPQILQSK